MYQENARLGALLMVAAGFAFASMSAFLKIAAAGLPDATVVFLRNLFGLMWIAPWLVGLHPASLRTDRIGFHLLRTAFGLTAMGCFFWAISQLRLAEAVLLNYSQPLFIPFIAWAWLSEKPPRAIYPAVVVGFIGVILILKPGANVASLGGLVGLCAGAFAALAMVTIRRMSDSEPTTRIVFYYAFFATMLSALILPWFWQTPNAKQWLSMLAASAFGTAGQILLTRAYALAPAAKVGSLIYVAVVFAGIYGWLFWDEALDRYTLLGILLVIAAGILAIRQRRPRRAPRPAAD